MKAENIVIICGVVVFIGLMIWLFGFSEKGYGDVQEQMMQERGYDYVSSWSKAEEDFSKMSQGEKDYRLCKLNNKRWFVEDKTCAMKLTKENCIYVGMSEEEYYKCKGGKK